MGIFSNNTRHTYGCIAFYLLLHDLSRLVKTDYTLVKFLSYTFRHLDDICMVYLRYFGDTAKYIYDNTLSLEGSTRNYKQCTFRNFIFMLLTTLLGIGIHYEVFDLNFKVTSYFFPTEQYLFHVGLYNSTACNIFTHQNWSSTISKVNTV